MRLKAIVRTYIRHIWPRAEEELEWFRSRPSVKAAIQNAALAVNSRSKRYSHQRRLKKRTLEEAREVLLRWERRLREAKEFDELFDMVDTALEHVNGVGELYVYDTSLRLGARLNLEPTRVYLHAGTRAGARALGLNARARAIATFEIPVALRELRPYEIEDVLCIFKNKFNNPPQDPSGLSLKSWCI
jgi:hypothetical protein